MTGETGGSRGAFPGASASSTAAGTRRASSTAAGTDGLVVQGLTKSYGGQPVLRGVDLAVPGGALLAVLGPSGSGKTTLLRIVAGFEPADDGSVLLGGEVVDDGRIFVPPERRGIGYVSQEGSLFPHLTVEANVGFGLPRRRRRGGRATELLAMVGLDGYEQRYPHQLSGGQQQRVALARALAVQPRLVLLDEPFAGLDAALRAAVRDDVRRVLREAGTTAVLVTHDQDEALSVADRVAVIRDGRIAQVGTPGDVYRRPTDPEVARFVGEANLLPGRIAGDQVDTVVGRLSILGARPGERSAPAPPPDPATRRSGRVSDGDDGRVVALLRPEQVDVVAAGDPSGGVAGVVRQCQYYGHDAVVTVDLAGAAGVAVVARVAGAPPAPGTAVALRAEGPVTVWPVTPDDAQGPHGGMNPPPGSPPGPM